MIQTIQENHQFLKAHSDENQYLTYSNGIFVIMEDLYE